eukprot:1245453-Rhodomonas_salina.4
MPGTKIAYRTATLSPSDAMSGTGVAYARTYVTSGTDAAHRCSRPFAMSGTDVACATTRRKAQEWALQSSGSFLSWVFSSLSDFGLCRPTQAPVRTQRPLCDVRYAHSIAALSPYVRTERSPGLT